MLTFGTRAKVVAFVILGVVVLVFTAVRYANLGRFIGLGGYYTVSMDLPNAGGIFPNADVTYRGVSVGRVGAMSLTANGVLVDLNISNSAPKIPSSGLQATVADLSAVGEEYVNLQPAAGGGPYLTAGSVIPQRSTQLPPPITNVLSSINTFVTSVPQQSLRTVVSELGNAFAGQGPNLQVLLDTSSTLTRAAVQNIPQATRLINDGRIVLATQAADTAAIQSFGSSARQLASQLVSSDADLRALIANTPQAALQLTGLLRDNNFSLSAVIANLLTTSDVTLTRQSALTEMLSALPAAIAAGSTVINSNGANFGMALTFFNPYPCTSGYGGTVYRNGLNLSSAPPVNASARCTAPASSGINVRGSANAPPGGAVPPAATPGSATAGAAAAGTLGGQSTHAAALPSGSAGMSQLLGLAP
jgi:phospholipid/cholesterol/gamma-HCH transport system substrate-binding protein